VTLRTNVKNITLIISLLVLFLLSVQVASAAEITVFSQNYSEMEEVPYNMMLSNNLNPDFSNMTLGYDSSSKAVVVSSVYYNVGGLYIGGFTPSTKTRYYVTINLERTNWNSKYYIMGTGFLIQFQNRSTSDLRISNLWTNSSGVQTTYFTVPAGTYSKPFTLIIDFDGETKTYTTTVGASSLTTPL
jgi:hypothetical protein